MVFQQTIQERNDLELHKKSVVKISMITKMGDRQQRRGNDLLRENASSEARLTRLFFSGAERTKKSALLTETKQLFKAKTLGELVISAYDAKLQMEKDGLFEHVDVVIDVDKNNAAVSADNGYEVTFIGKEPSLRKGRINYDVSNRGESNLTFAGQELNAFGRGEIATAEISRGSMSTTSASLGFIKPLLKWRDARLGVSLSHSSSQYPWSGFGNTENALGVDLTHEPIKNFLTHQIKYMAAWRKVEILNEDAPFSVRQYAGHNLKSSIQSSLSYDSRDDPVLASKGVLLRLTNEFAGLGGNAHFFRQEFYANLSTKLPFDIILSSGFRSTFVRPLGLQQSPEKPLLSVVDRTFLGGSTDLRGFDLSGVGPVDDDCFLGGMASWCGALHLYKRLRPQFLFGHVFASAGNIHPVSNDLDVRPVVQELLQEPRASLGLGLAIKVSRLVRLEFNYCRPVFYRETDKTRHGFQFGIGLIFV
uniref:Bacterial surface antigen (D15) domain-containing protein n=1 Tax=Romanomermis culicivorax TaxID=13658 RepID=A0A915I9M8_ROMCU